MKHIKGYKVFESNTDDYYNQISIVYISKNLYKDRFIDIDNRVVNFVKNNISGFIKENNTRIRIFEDNKKDSGIYSDNSIYNLTINGFDYSLQRRICHPVSEIKWIRNVRIFSLTDDYYIVYFTMNNTFMYFLCDQFDGLVKLLVDYKICDEPVNESNMFKEEDYYTEMLYDDARGMITSKKRLAFSDKEMHILEDISDKKGYKYSVQPDVVNFGSCVNFYKESQPLNIDGVSRFKQVLTDLTKSMCKFDDEWYIFMRYNKKMDGLSEVYYKCDGFEGLLRCINDMMPDMIKENLLSDCDYYSKISPSKFLELENYEINIQKYYKTINDYISNNFSEEYTDIRISKYRKVISINFNRYTFGIKRIDIFLIDDEYFIVDVFETGNKSVFYKCDQIDGLIQLFNDIKNNTSLDESSSYQDESLVRRVDDLEYERWIQNRKPENFNKRDTVVVLEIIKNLDQNYFGQKTDKYPFGKERMSSYWIKNTRKEFRNYFIDRTLDEIKIMSDFLFTNYNFDGIHINYYYNHIHFDKYQDEWYDVIISSHRGGLIRYICDSIDGLKEVVNMVNDLKFESENVNESIELDESLVKKIDNYEFNEFFKSHKLDKHTEDDVEIYMSFLTDMYDENEISIDSHFLEPGKTWTAMIEESGYDTTGCFNIDKFEDEWYLVERQIDDNWSPVVDYWLIDTKDGFKQLKNEIFE